MGLNLVKKTYKHNFGEHLTIVLKEMCSRVNADYEKIPFNEDGSNWFLRFEWSPDEENEFKKWLMDYLYSNSKSRREIMAYPVKTKKMCSRVANSFVSNYGWRTSENENI
jgi:hypothetical protein